MLMVKKFSLILFTCVFAITYGDIALASQAVPGTFADVVEKAMPAVVNIATTQRIEARNPLEDLRSEIPEGTPFDHFFKEFLDREFNVPEARKRKATSLGSGFIIHPDGYIVTNAHVVESADEVSVTLSSDPDKIYNAKLIGSDKKADLAVLKIESKTPLPHLQFGDAEQARVGDWVIAIGNPFGLGGSVTTGIISAKSRFIGGQYDELIQTDASINRGNSGGPMLNLQGQVIGINSVIISNTGGNIGIGFSIPANQAKPIIEQLKGAGKIVRGWLGVGIQGINEDIAKNIGLPASTKGLVVTQVMKDSPADKAGIKVGDVIVSFDGAATFQPQKLSRVVSGTKIGNKSTVDIIRDSKPIKIVVTVEKMAEEKTDVATTSSGKEGTSVTDHNIGVRIENITPQLRQKFKLDPQIHGVLIVGVNRNSPAADAGLVVGDVILQINRHKIENVSAALQEIERAKKAGSKNIAILAAKGSDNLFILLELQ
jgi:serine protease Do